MAAAETTLARGAIGLREVLFQSVTGLAIGIWYVIGIVVLVYLYIRHPARLPEMRRVFADEDLPAPGEPVTSGEAA